MQINFRHGLMPKTMNFSGNVLTSVEAQEAAEAAARAGSTQAAIASASAASGYAAAQAARIAYENALAAGKSAAQAGEAARLIAEQKRQEHDLYMENKRLELVERAMEEGAAANAYYNEMKLDLLRQAQDAKAGGVMGYLPILAAAAATYFILKG